MAEERSGLHQRGDEEISFATFKPRHEKGSNKSLVYVFASFVILFAIVLVFASIVLRVEIPKIELRSATVNQVSYTTSPSPSFNGTMIAYLTIENPNFGRFSFDNGTLNVLYEGDSVGEKGFGSARVKARETEGMNLTVNMRSTKLLDTGDIKSEMLNLTSYTKLSGKVHFFKILKRTTIVEMDCIMNLNLTSKSIQNIQC